MTILQTVIYHPSAREKMQRDNYYTHKGKPGKPCGHGNQPPCAIPLSDYLPVLIVFAVVLAYKKLR